MIEYFDFSPAYVSLKISIMATCLTFLCGVSLGYATKGKKNLVMELLDSLLMIPLVLPPTVIGLVLLLGLGIQSPLGAFLDQIGVVLVFSWQGAVIAASIVSLPIMYQTARSAFEQVDPELIASARTLGAGRLRIFQKIIFPLAAPGILAGTILSFARALGEFGATLMIAGNIPGRTQTLPMAVYFSNEGGNTDAALCYTGIILLISATSLVAIKYVNNRSNYRFAQKESINA